MSNIEPPDCWCDLRPSGETRAVWCWVRWSAGWTGCQRRGSPSEPPPCRRCDRAGTVWTWVASGGRTQTARNDIKHWISFYSCQYWLLPANQPKIGWIPQTLVLFYIFPLWQFLHYMESMDLIFRIFNLLPLPCRYFEIIFLPYFLYHFSTFSCSYLSLPLRKNLSLKHDNPPQIMSFLLHPLTCRQRAIVRRDVWLWSSWSNV